MAGPGGVQNRLRRDALGHQTAGANQVRLELDQRGFRFGELGSGLVDLLVSEAANHLGEAGRGEVAGRFGLAEESTDPSAVELDHHVAGLHPVALLDGEAEDGLLALGAELDAMAFQSADGNGRAAIATAGDDG